MQYGWPESVRDAVRRPLFAIVMGLKRLAGATPRSKGELLASLVAAVVEHGVPSETIPILRQLARLVTENQGPVDRGELGSSVDRMLASASRIVREEDGKIDFALPVLAQWFAADALIAGDVTVTELVTSRPRLDRWRYALGHYPFDRTRILYRCNHAAPRLHRACLCGRDSRGQLPALGHPERSFGGTS